LILNILKYLFYEFSKSNETYTWFSSFELIVQHFVYTWCMHVMHDIAFIVSQLMKYTYSWKLFQAQFIHLFAFVTLWMTIIWMFQQHLFPFQLQFKSLGYRCHHGHVWLLDQFQWWISTFRSISHITTSIVVWSQSPFRDIL
jgi:hypothetical protein